MPILAHERITAGDGPVRWIYMLHGIFGSGRNWGSVARRLTRARPEWGAVLVDLRQHGASSGFPPPHTVDAAARDVLALVHHTGLAADAVLGHSFGGKVALAAAELASPHPAQVWVIDSTPEARTPAGGAWDMLRRIQALPDRFPDRGTLVAALQNDGLEAPVAQWMATNLEAADDGYRWRFDLEAIDALIRDFFAVDLWALVEDPPPGVSIHLVKARDSEVLSGDSLARARRAADAGSRTVLHVVDGGHWVNADNPQALHDLLVANLSAGSTA